MGDVWRLPAEQLATPPSGSMGSAASGGFRHPHADAAGPTSPCQDITEAGPAKHRPHLSWEMEQCCRAWSPRTSTHCLRCRWESGMHPALWLSLHRDTRTGLQDPPRQSQAVPGPYLPISLLGGSFGRSCSLLIPPGWGLSCGRCFYLAAAGRKVGERLPDPARKKRPAPLHQGRNSAKHPKGQPRPSHPAVWGSPVPQHHSTRRHPEVPVWGTHSSVPGFFSPGFGEDRETPGRKAACFRAGFRQPGTHVYFGF